MTRIGWPGAAVLTAVGLILWFVVAPLLSPPAFATIVLVLGILLAVVGIIMVVASFLPPRGP